MITAIAERQDEIGALCRRFGVARLDLFGSGATGSLVAKSDLDFVVEFAAPGGPGYADRYFGLLESLEALFGRDVDLVVERAISNPYFQESVDRSRVPLFAV
jgi:uncharacterized protein